MAPILQYDGRVFTMETVIHFFVLRCFIQAGRGQINQIFTFRQVIKHCFTFQRPTGIVFLDILAAFDTVGSYAQQHRLLRNIVPEKFVPVLKELYDHTSSQVRAYG